MPAPTKAAQQENSYCPGGCSLPPQARRKGEGTGAELVA